MNAMLFQHSRYPNAAKEYLRFMMEAPQYGPWLENSLGYWSQPLKAYCEDEVLDRRSEAEAVRRGYGFALLRWLCRDRSTPPPVR